MSVEPSHKDVASRGNAEARLDALLSEPISSVRIREGNAFNEIAAPFETSLVLFGAGGLGRRTLAGLRRIGIEPLAFIDNNPTLWHSRIDDLEVLSPVYATERYGNGATYVVAIWHAGGSHRFANASQQLEDLGCERIAPFVPLYWKYPEFFLPYYAVDLPHKVVAQASAIQHAFTLIEDQASQDEYLSQLRWRLLSDFGALSAPVRQEQYFPDDLLALRTDEVFLDCGAFNGDTLRAFLKHQPMFAGKYFAFEPDPANFGALESYIQTLPSTVNKCIFPLQLATGSVRGRVRFNAEGMASSGADIKGQIEVDCVPLDEVLQDEVPSFLKMDVEGAERETISGAQGIIARSNPIIATSAYHQQDDLWVLPNTICTLSSSYRLHLRPHNEEGWDLVCYAIPSARSLS